MNECYIIQTYLPKTGEWMDLGEYVLLTHATAAAAEWFSGSGDKFRIIAKHWDGEVVWRHIDKKS